MYPILSPQYPIPAFKGLCALAVMAKAPRPGNVKTRLSPPLTPQQAANLNTCFLRDTAENLALVRGTAGLVSYTPVGDEALFEDLLPSTFSLVPQRDGTFGERLLAAAQDILALGFASVCLIDSDSPTVPTLVFRQAVEVLTRPGNRIVLGPSDDGGYYLIGLKEPREEPFMNITWSTAAVLEETIQQCRQADIEVTLLPTWYDVDDSRSLHLLTAEILNGSPPAFAALPGYPAQHTRGFLLGLKSNVVADAAEATAV